MCVHASAHTPVKICKRRAIMIKIIRNEIAITKIAWRRAKEGQMARKEEERRPAAMLRTQMNARIRSDPSRKCTTRKRARKKSLRRAHLGFLQARVCAWLEVPQVREDTLLELLHVPHGPSERLESEDERAHDVRARNVVKSVPQDTSDIFA